MGLGAWGVITGIGLVDLRAWARASILAFSGLVIPFYLSFTLMEVTGSQGNGLSTDFPSFWLSVVFLPCWAAVCWTAYFNLRGVRKRFEASRPRSWTRIDSNGAPDQNVRAHRAPTVSFTTSLYTAGSLLFLLGLLRGVPASLLGRPLEGAAAGTLNAASCAAALAITAGLLRHRQWARVAAVMACELLLLNWYAFMTKPWAEVHVAAALEGIGVRIPVEYAADLLPFVLDLSTFLLSILCLAIMGSLVLSRSALAGQLAQQDGCKG
jgi:hypothetical protein